MVAVSLILVFASTASFSREAGPAQRQYQTAMGAFLDEFYPAAASLFEKFIADHPENTLVPEAKFYLAKCFYHRQNYSKSLIKLKELSQKPPPELESAINYWIAKIFYQKEDFGSCLEHLKKTLNDPESQHYLEAKYLQAQTYLKLNKKEKAKINFQALIKKSDRQDLKDSSFQNLLSLYKQSEDFNKIKFTAQNYLKDNPETKIKDQIHFYLGKSWNQKNQLPKAISSYKLALKETKNPNLRDLVYQNLGLAYLEQGKSALGKRTIDRINNNQQRLYAQGLYYLNSQNQIQALESFSNYIRRYPEGKFLAKTYLMKADLLYETGRINDSASLYYTIIENFPQPEHDQVRNLAHYGLAWCYFKKRNFNKAINRFQKTLQTTQDHSLKIISQIQIGDAYLKSGKHQKALDTYNQILKKYPATLHKDYIQFQIGMLFIEQRMIDKALLAFSNLIENFPGSYLLPKAKYYQAVGHFWQREYEKTRHLLSSLKEEYPDKVIIPEAKYLYAKCLFNQGQYRKALEKFKEISLENKNLPVAEFSLMDAGLAHLNLKEFAKAKETYLHFLQTYPGSEHFASVAFQLGGLYEMKENYQEAKRYYKKVIENSKKTSVKQEAWFSLGHLAWNEGNLIEAEKYFHKGSQTETSIGLKNKLYLAKIYQERGQTKKALALYEKLINSQTDISKIALANKGLLFEKKEKYAKAIKFLKQAYKEKEVSSPQILFSLANCLEKENLTQEALKYFFELIYSYPKEADYKVRAYFRIARLYENQNDFNQAQQAYQKIIDLGARESNIAKARLKRIKTQK